jgi:E3 ubiquitin-protein ligase UBR1
VDAFNALASFTLCSIPAYDIDVKSAMKIFYIAEIAKVIVKFTQVPGQLGKILETVPNTEPFDEATFKAFMHAIIQNNFNPSSQPTRALWALVQPYALVFLRKCILLMHTRYGIDFPIDTTSSSVPELTRLTQLLQLPSLTDLLGEALESQLVSSLLPYCAFHTDPVTLLHPGIPELVGLPHTFDALLEEALKHNCPTTGNAITDPAMCLFCGDIFCSQATCCALRKDGYQGVGGCYQHRTK